MKNICDYGCGKESNFQLKNGKFCCSKRPAGCSVLKEINSAATKKVYDRGLRASQKEVYKNLPQEVKDSMNWAKGKSITPTAEMLKQNSFYSNESVKSRILKDNLLEYKCIKCGCNGLWQGETIVLDLDHINGDNTDNRLENLRFLCPNCHSQTSTYKGRNKNTGKQKVSDKELLTAYKKCSNIRQALIEVGLAAKGGNYERLKRLIRGCGEIGKHT
jgi:Zn finger protein HypA/HybF involved in hydrogenase expression